MQISLLNFENLVNIGAAAAQKACAKLANLATGSATRSIIEASGSVALWLQYVAVQIWLGTRLATSSGAEVDSFIGDFSLTREPAVASSGLVTFARTAGISTIITPYFNVDGSISTSGAVVMTADNTQTFGVVVDTTNTAWNNGMGGYYLPVGTPSIDVPVRAITPGAAGNVQAASISLLTTPLPGITSVTNATQFTNGTDAEGDDSAKARFKVFIATRSRATAAAIANAIQTVQQNISYNVIENTLPNGAFRPGFFTVTVDDGTGNPPTSLISLVYAAIDPIRPIGSTFAVQPPAVLQAGVNMTIAAASGYVKSALQAQVASAIITYINTLGIGQTLSYTRLSALAYGVAGVSAVSNVTLNNGNADLGGGPTQTVKATSASVVIN